VRLLSYESDTGPKPAALVAGGLVPLGARFDSVVGLVAAGPTAWEAAREEVIGRSPSLSLSQVRILAPIPDPIRDVWCVGWNYLRHFQEGIGRREGQEVELPKYPTFFTKATRAVIAPGDDIFYDSLFSEQMDYEAELAVIIGREGRDIPESEALSYVFGYTAANDVSARDVMRRHGGQWLKGKSMDASCPLGPWIVTADEIPDPQRLTVRCLVNGDIRQESSTAHMIFPVARLISELSRAMTLLPGDILLTGTPDGTGFSRTPPLFLRPGDEVVVQVDQIGTLANRVGPDLAKTSSVAGPGTPEDERRG
jgi:2,4-diketo-3-deoxy-L-fuconate hydrolase